MLILLIAIITGLFFLSYFGVGKDFFAPTTVQILTFLFACLMCGYLLYDSGLSYQLHANTVWLITTCLAMSTGIGVITHQVFRRVKIARDDNAQKTMTPISRPISIMAILVLAVTVVWTLAEIVRIGGNTGSFSEIMIRFRNRNSHSTDLDAKLPFILRQLQKVVFVLFLVYFCDLIRFFKELSLSGKLIDAGIICLCIVAQLLNGSRTATVNNLIACVMMLHLFRIQRQGEYKVYSLKFIGMLIAFCCGVLWLFSLTRGVVGRGTSTGAMRDLSIYTGAPILNLDLYLQNPTRNTDIVGKYTFFNIISNLRALGVDIPQYTVHQEYRNLNGINLGNVYTLFRIYYADFGLVGVYVFHGLASLLLSVFYEYVKKRQGNLGILLFSSIYYTAVLSFFAERFFSNIFSISMAVQLLSIVAFYLLFMQKKVRFPFDRRSSGPEQAH